eukprot:Lankesteria_metandrocarpae@DN348_c0_g1_i1.p1
MAKMGYSGGGLGGDGSGRINPVEAKLRVKGRGLQEHGENPETAVRGGAKQRTAEHRSAVRLLLDHERSMNLDADDSLTGADVHSNSATRGVATTGWQLDRSIRKGGSRNKLIYRTAEEVMNESEVQATAFRGTATEGDSRRTKGSKAAFRIVDMTGPDVRIVTDSAQLVKPVLMEDACGVKDKSTDVEPLRELRYNLTVCLTTLENALQSVTKLKQDKADEILRLTALESQVYANAHTVAEVDSMWNADSATAYNALDDIYSRILSVRRLRQKARRTGVSDTTGTSANGNSIDDATKVKLRQARQAAVDKYTLTPVMDTAESTHSAATSAEDDNSITLGGRLDSGALSVAGGIPVTNSKHTSSSREEGVGRGDGRSVLKGSSSTVVSPLTALLECTELGSRCKGLSKSSIMSMHTANRHSSVGRSISSSGAQHGLQQMGDFGNVFAERFSCWVALADGLIHLWRVTVLELIDESKWRPLLESSKFTAEIRSAATYFERWTNNLNEAARTVISITSSSHVARRLRNTGADSILPAFGAKVVGEVIFQNIRRDIVNHWEPKEVEPALVLIESWQTILQKFSLIPAVSQTIVPKLIGALQLWSPLKDTTPVHAWLHPWLPVLKDDLCVLWSLLKTRIAVCLCNWTPSDKSVLSLLQPWLTVMDIENFQNLMQRHILPKLKQHLGATPIVPDSHAVEPLVDVYEWAPLVGIEFVAAIISAFFERWLSVLDLWLKSSTVDYREVMMWYQSWKSVIPNQLLSHDFVETAFVRGLEIINLACTVALQRGPVGVSVSNPGNHQQQPSHFEFSDSSASKGGSAPTGNSTFQTPLPPEEPPPLPPTATTVSTDDSDVEMEDADFDIRVLLENVAAKHDLVMQPKPGRKHSSRPVYRFGSCSIIFDKSAVFVRKLNEDEVVWNPTSIENLLKIAKKKSK